MGKIIKIFQKNKIEKAANAKPDRIFNKAWPEVMLANNRTDKLMIRDAFETNSIKIINGTITNGEPDGKKWLQKKILLKKKPWNQIPNINTNERIIVTNNWLVTVCE